MQFFRAFLLLMAIAVDSRQTGTSSAGGSSLSWTHTVGSISNGILIVAGAEASAGNQSISGVNWDDSGTPVALTRKGRINDSAVTGWAEWWYLLAPKAGTFTIKTTNTGSCACTSGSASYSGVDQTTPFNASSPQSATGTTATATVNISSAVGELVIDSVSDNENATDTLVIGGGQTKIYNITNGTNNAGASSEENGAASVTMSWTGLTLSAPWAIIGVSLRPATDSTGGYVAPATSRPAKLAGPYDPKGFLLSPFKRYDYTPSVAASSPITVLADFGQLTLTAFAPVLDTAENAGLGSLTLTGFVPTIALTLNTGLGALTLTGLAPVLNTKLNTALGQLTLSAFAPVLASTINAGLGSLILSAFAPVLNTKLNLDVGALTLSGQVPTVLIGTNLLTALGLLQLDGFAPDVQATANVSVSAGLGLLSITAFAPDVQVPPAMVTQQPSGGHRIPNKYEDLNPRRARALAAKRRLDEERKRLARLKKQEAKVVAEYKAIALPETPAVPKTVTVSNRALRLKEELTDLAERVSMQAATVRQARKEADQARREAEQRESDATELAMQAHRELIQDEWERQETARIEQERSDEEMQMLLTLIHEEDF